jgi:hypothetical protein
MKVKLDEVLLDEDIYPRRNISHKTIESYVEALKGGATFPPIEVQKVIVEEDEREIEKLICLDGWHRILAYKEYNKQVKAGQRIEEIEAVAWKKEALSKKEWLEELRVESARRNIIHGDRLSPSDLKFQLLRILEVRPIERLNGVIKEFAEKFQYSESYISGLIGEEVRKRRVSRDVQIYRISLLGWTQEEIGILFGLTQPAILNIIKKFTTEVSYIQDQFYEKHKPISELAKFYNLDDITTWAIVLQAKSDLERFKLFGKPEYQDDAPRDYNVWNFIQRDPRLGYECPGNIPGQIAMNVLYYYTNQGDLVVDPMAGGGSTIDACLVMGRRCRAYDIVNEWEHKGVKYSRKDIIVHDLRNGFPKEAKGCDLIFLDPPYWRLQRGVYTIESVSENPLDEWRKFMQKVAKDSYNTVKEKGYVALVIEAFLDEKITGEFLDLPFECVGWFKDAGFKEVQRISIPMPSEIKSVQDLEYARKKKLMLDLNRDLIIFKRE